MITIDESQEPNENSGIFGLDVDYEQAQLVLIPVPWEGTVSYGTGTACGPSAILQASHQLDLFDLDFQRPYQAGICYDPCSYTWPYLASKDKVSINLASERVHELVYRRAKKILDEDRFAAVIGGEHSVSYGILKALSEKYENFGILHIDAHHDLREAYQGYKYSHASIMYNVMMDFPSVNKLISVGIRDFCEAEYEFAKAQKSRIYTLYDQKMFEFLSEGRSYTDIVQETVKLLPKQVYISFDIDGLDPSLCSGTGTPVPGGLSFHQAISLILEVVRSGRRIIGFDLCEVAPSDSSGEWNENVGARILYKLCGALVESNGLVGKA